MLTFVSLKFPDVFRLTSRFRGVVVLGSLPRSLSGHSIFMISAPRAPSQRVAHGPARTQLKSTTRMFSSARGRDMASFSRGAVPLVMLGERPPFDAWLRPSRVLSALSPGGLAANSRNGDVPHRRIGLGAMPVAFTGLDMHDITHIDLTLLMLRRHHAGA